MKRLTVIIVAVIIGTLAGCSSGSGFISTEEKFGGSEGSIYQPTGSVNNSSGYHVVRKGDTLYSIAWRYGLDYQGLARANGISSPYTIFPGQKIDVRAKSSTVAVSNPSSASTSVSKPAPAAPAPVISAPTAPPAAVSTTVTSTPVVSTPSTPVVSGPVATTPVATAPVPIVVTPVTTEPVSSAAWRWPVPGKILAQFSTSKPVNKGIDLAGVQGESVSAAAGGTVVYAGQGLRGYGNLVIIKHDETYLSAYAHASRILVKEKDQVKAGEVIAEVGSTGTDSVKLHFEVRKNGKPVDPLLYLPAR
ncbi:MULTISPECIES: peptidoglycan DD-metalloendopeptidase family protein [unclassified Oceanobacter]|uniref:peptidoglycan DD-metalloendopeptidase family protein n=1 Tax=unclassified Oceanobacter TaxID=2620260 RepID=UPI002732A8F5|nr:MULTISPECIES: peptidoglycan DD-metalloendopeptidase family protein [unclassified Oceanobacter]MDP2608254.1 peptidoglycan DD-metalloendopeptidase family protein [Oceanobacter sp. 1_MG-2023]MDP2612139.1 peptidoglycan DD-metalloendopeptidase family protein [Oceanobacter sp. 2_MG-2023]